MRQPRGPWWVYGIAGSVVAYLALMLWADVFGPGGFGARLRFDRAGVFVVEVVPGYPAAGAGLQPGDRIDSVLGQRVTTLFDWHAMGANIEVDSPAAVGIERAGQPRDVRVSFGAQWHRWEGGDWLIFALRASASLVTLALSLLIATRRPRDPVALVGAWWLAAACVTNFIPLAPADPHVPSFPPGTAAIWRSLPEWLTPPLWVGVATFLLGPLLSIIFFGLFPRPLFRAPRVWALWSLTWAPALVVGIPRLLLWVHRVVYDPAHATGGLPGWYTRFFGAMIMLALATALAILAVNYRRLHDVTERRRLRVILIGTTVGLAGSALVGMAGFFSTAPALQRMLLSTPSRAAASVLFPLVPLSFAYGILRHQLLDVGVILRQGLQYALARRLVVSLVPACAAVLAIDMFIHGDQPFRSIVLSRGWIYAAVAAAALAAHYQRTRWLDAIDRRFFRERYDAQRLLSQAVDDIRCAKGLQGVATEAVARLAAALHPIYVAVLVREPRDPAYRVLASVPAEGLHLALTRDTKLVALARLLGKPLELGSGQSGSIVQQLPPDEVELVRRSGLGLIVAVATPVEGTEVLLALGTKRSEEPYSADDQQLLGAIAASLALLVERPAAGPPADVFAECPQCGACSTAGGTVCAGDGSPLTEIRLPRVLAKRYRLDRRLGRGGMGTVYEAADLELGRRVAVKVIREELVGSPAAADRFRLEARAAAGFSHPNVVVVHDFGVVRDTRAFLVMELLRGSSLREVLRREGYFPPGRTVAILRDLGAAVDAAHARHLVHRDLKPENVFLAGDGPAGQVKLLDFGLAKFMAGNEEMTATAARATATGQIVGTVHYMGPEQLRGSAAGTECDLWAIAVMAYEMLAGALPFEGPTAADYQSRVLSGRFTPIQSRLPEAPASLQEFFARAFALDPARRPGRAPSLVADLEVALAIDPLAPTSS